MKTVLFRGTGVVPQSHSPKPSQALGFCGSPQPPRGEDSCRATGSWEWTAASGRDSFLPHCLQRIRYMHKA